MIAVLTWPSREALRGLESNSCSEPREPVMARDTSSVSVLTSSHANTG